MKNIIDKIKFADTSGKDTKYTLPWSLTYEAISVIPYSKWKRKVHGHTYFEEHNLIARYEKRIPGRFVSDGVVLIDTTNILPKRKTGLLKRIGKEYNVPSQEQLEKLWKTFNQDCHNKMIPAIVITTYSESKSNPRDTNELLYLIGKDTDITIVVNARKFRYLEKMQDDFTLWGNTKRNIISFQKSIGLFGKGVCLIKGYYEHPTIPISKLRKEIRK